MGMNNAMMPTIGGGTPGPGAPGKKPPTLLANYFRGPQPAATIGTPGAPAPPVLGTPVNMGLDVAEATRTAATLRRGGSGGPTSSTRPVRPPSVSFLPRVGGGY